MNFVEIGILLLVFASAATVVGLLSGAASDAVSQRLRMRLMALKEVDGDEPSGVLRARYLRQLPPWERWLEQQPGMPALATLVEQAGHSFPAYRVILAGLAIAPVLALVFGAITHNAIVALVAAIVGAFLPIGKLILDKGERVRKLDEQLPDALDLMTRSLRAGNPLNESIKFVADEIRAPLGTDFEWAWSSINFGVSMKGTLLHLLERSPSVSLRAMVTAILVQRETGGNLAEVLTKIADVLRDRAKFQRRLKTLTAEGRMSAWVLSLMPFGLAGALSVTNPSYLPMLLGDPTGVKLVLSALGWMAIGVFWITRIVKIRV